MPHPGEAGFPRATDSSAVMAGLGRSPARRGAGRRAEIPAGDGLDLTAPHVELMRADPPDGPTRNLPRDPSLAVPGTTSRIGTAASADSGAATRSPLDRIPGRIRTGDLRVMSPEVAARGTRSICSVRHGGNPRIGARNFERRKKIHTPLDPRSGRRRSRGEHCGELCRQCRDGPCRRAMRLQAGLVRRASQHLLDLHLRLQRC